MEQREALFARQDLTRLLWPLVVEQVLAVTIGMADTAMVSTVGEAAVSAISLVDSINILLINLFSALATGGAVVAAQYIGHGEQKKACDAANHLMLAAVLLAAVLGAAALVGNRPILSLVFGRLDEDIMRGAMTYFTLSALSYPFLAAYNGSAALFRAMGNSKVSMFTSLIMNLCNIGGNALLIYGFKLGVLGAGIATLVSRAAGAAVMCYLLADRHRPLHLRPLREFVFRRDLLRRILRVGVPNGLENSMFQVGKLLVAGLISSFGKAIIAANAIANNISSLAVLPGNAIGLGMITVVGQCVGAGEYGQAKAYTRKLMGLIYGMMLALNLLIFALNRPIVSLFNLSPEAVEAAVSVLSLYTVCCAVAWPPSFALPCALRAAGDARFTMIVSVVSMWTFRIGLSYLLGRTLGMGLMGVWIAMIVDWCARSACFIPRFLRGKWLAHRVI